MSIKLPFVTGNFQIFQTNPKIASHIHIRCSDNEIAILVLPTEFKKSITRSQTCELLAASDITNVAGLCFEEIRGIVKINVENVV